MSILQSIIISIIILLAIPLGIWLSKLTKEELIRGRKAFKLIILVSLLIIVMAPFLNLVLDAKIFLVTSALFVLVLALTSLKISFLKTRKKKKRK